jgi:hypothetical protein
MIIARVTEYNQLIDDTINQLQSSGLVTCEQEIYSFNQALQAKKLKVIGLIE